MPCGGVSEGKLVLFSPHPRLSFSSFSGIVSVFSGGHNISLQMSCLQYLSTVTISTVVVLSTVTVSTVTISTVVISTEVISTHPGSKCPG